MKINKIINIAILASFLALGTKTFALVKDINEEEKKIENMKGLEPKIEYLIDGELSWERDPMLTPGDKILMGSYTNHDVGNAAEEVEFLVKKKDILVGEIPHDIYSNLSKTYKTYTRPENMDEETWLNMLNNDKGIKSNFQNNYTLLYQSENSVIFVRDVAMEKEQSYTRRHK